MKDFDRRWQECAAAARKGAETPAAMPLGFATRITARLGAPRAASWEAVWLGMSRRALALLSLVLLAGVLVDPSKPPPPSLRPPLEQIVPDLLGLL